MHFLHTPAEAQRDKHACLLLAPGSMGPMDNPTLELLSRCLAEAGISVTRFEFDYMAQRRTSGTRRPPPRAEKLLDEYRDAISALSAARPAAERLLIGGKSLGGRVASLIADEQFAAGAVHGLVCFGYPFHPPGKPERLRTEHLCTLHCPALIIQGERDPFGAPEDVAGYELANTITIVWTVDGDHDLKPRKKSGATHEGNLAHAARAVAGFVDRLSDRA